MQLKVLVKVMYVWYGNEDTNKQVEDYINKYTEEYDNRIFKIESKTSELIDTEREVIVKARINQDKYREDLLKKYGKCCLCGVQNQELLIASHLKPWSKSDKKEKLDIENGHGNQFLNGSYVLCAHQTLFAQCYTFWSCEHS